LQGEQKHLYKQGIAKNARKIFLVREKNYPRGKIIFSSWEKFFGSIWPFLGMVKRVDKV
jgi:hypothetical protein